MITIHIHINLLLKLVERSYSQRDMASVSQKSSNTNYNKDGRESRATTLTTSSKNRIYFIHICRQNYYLFYIIFSKYFSHELLFNFNHILYYDNYCPPEFLCTFILSSVKKILLLSISLICIISPI